MPDFICPTCGRKMNRDLAIILPHTEEHIIDEIKKKHPDWVEANGICKMCYEHYKKMLHPS
ncbi:MAG: hypothetical protein JW800_01715 [Candidatus Omnitrophica bacterium]|nr:hypothetical protein [Candidatus Omnitrophota bacterium]